MKKKHDALKVIRLVAPALCAGVLSAGCGGGAAPGPRALRAASAISTFRQCRQIVAPRPAPPKSSYRFALASLPMSTPPILLRDGQEEDELVKAFASIDSSMSADQWLDQLRWIVAEVGEIRVNDKRGTAFLVGCSSQTDSRVTVDSH
jgi:hypothetical protein